MPSKQEMDALVARSEHELIAEFIAQADVSRNTKQAYKRTLEEFACWLVHPKTRRKAGGSGALVETRRADVVRFAAYLSAGDRYAAGDHFRVRQELSAATRKRFPSRENTSLWPSSVMLICGATVSAASGMVIEYPLAGYTGTWIPSGLRTGPE